MEIDVTEIGISKIKNIPQDYTRASKARWIYNDQEVEICNVDFEQVDGDNIFNIEATVFGNYDDYTINLKLRNNLFEDASCTCPDYDKGNYCKHILATCLEVEHPHKPSTKEKLEEYMAKQRAEAEERYRQYMKEKEEEEKRREYQRKYFFALNMLNKYGRDITKKNTKDNEFDVNKIYIETINKIARENIISQQLCTNVKIEPRITIQGYNKLEVTFKIGETTMYVIKDLVDFYKAFKENRVIEFGRKLTMQMCKENFLKKDWGLFDIILKYGQMLEYNQKTNQDRYYGSYIASDKSISLFEEDVDKFFDVIKDREIQVESYNFKDNRFVFTQEKLNLHIELENTKEDEYLMKINIQDYDYIKTDKHIYVFYQGKIYILESNHDNYNVLSTFESTNKILIPSDKKEEFSTYVLPGFEKYMIDMQSKESSDDDSNDESIFVNVLASKMYLDLDDSDNIKLRLTFCYNDKEFNVLDKDYKEYVKNNNVKRNIEKEKEVLKRIFSDGFELSTSNEYFFMRKEEKIYDFLTEKIDGYMNEFEVLVTDKFKTKNVRKVKLNNISVKLESGLLEMDMSKLDIDMEEIKAILAQYNIKKKYYKLKNGDFIQLEESEELDFLNDVSKNLDVDFSKATGGVVKLAPNRSMYLEKILDKNKGISVDKNDNFSNLINNIADKNFSDNIVVSKSFEKVLRPYQTVGYKWLKVLENYGFGGILADDMGLGKTLQVIAMLETEMKAKTKKPSIVVCPSSLVLNWKAEVEKWCPKLKVLIVRGTANERKEIIKEYDKYDLVITSYDLLKRDVEQYEGKGFKYIIADEAQYIKNFSTQNATALKSLEGEIKFALTGTPIENSISELWSIFDFIMPGYLYNYHKFKKLFEEPILKYEDTKALEKLKMLIEPFVLRRIKKDVLTELPDKNVTILKNEMEKEQEKLYYAYMAQIKKEVTDEVSENGFEKSKLKILMLLTRLRQICCHPSLFLDNYKGESGKLKQCMDILEEAVESGHKILLFSQYTSMFEILEKEIAKLGIKYYKLVGSTPVDKRISMVESFNTNDDVKIFLISLKAGGTGLNLTGADVVIHYDPWWNLSSENQATDRAYRIGQKNSVQVYKLITSNSIEEKINKLQEKKAKISEQLLSTEETFINKLSKEEIMSLFE